MTDSEFFQSKIDKQIPKQLQSNFGNIISAMRGGYYWYKEFIELQKKEVDFKIKEGKLSNDDSKA